MRLLTLLFLFLFFFNGCQGQKCSNKDEAIEIISSLPEVIKQEKIIDSVTNHKHGVSYIVEDEGINKKEYLRIKTGYNGEFRWETYYIFYIDKKTCSLYYYDTINGNLLTIEQWRNKSNKQKMNNMEVIEFNDLFNEGKIIKFTPKDLNNNTPEIQEFKEELELYEKHHPNIEDFDSDDLIVLINNETFFDLQHYVDSSWLQYFITKYKVDVTKLSNLMSEAIKKEDYNAVKILIEKGYVVSNIELNIVKETIEDKKFNIEENQKEGYESYLVENSKIDDILKIIKSKYLTNHIEDFDGYTNLRKEKNAQSDILQKIKSEEHIEVLDNTGDWFKVKTKEGKTGYVHKSRIKSSNSHSTSYKLYNRPDFQSYAQEVVAKGEIEYLHQVSGWDFVKVNGITGYLATDEAKKEKEETEKKRFSFLAEEEEIKDKNKKKGFWDNLFG